MVPVTFVRRKPSENRFLEAARLESLDSPVSDKVEPALTGVSIQHYRHIVQRGSRSP